MPISDDGWNVQRLVRHADDHQRAVHFQQAEVVAHIHAGGDRVDDEIEPVRVFLEYLPVARRDEMVRTHAQGVFPLAIRMAEHGDVGAERARDLHAHVPETAETDDGNLLAGPAFQCMSGEYERDAGAQAAGPPCRAAGRSGSRIT